MKAVVKKPSLKEQLRKAIFRRDVTISGFEVNTPIMSWIGEHGYYESKHTGEVSIHITAFQKERKVKAKRRKKKK
jgi:hypothetical protein